MNTEQTEQNKNEYEAEAKKILKKIYKIKDSNIIRETEELIEVNKKVQKSMRNILMGGCVLIGVGAGVVIGIMTEGFEEQKPAFLVSAAYFISGVITYMLFLSGQLAERLKVKKELTKGLDMRINYKIKEIREGEKGNGKEKK